MSVGQLRRVDPTHNMARCYVMAVQPTLFGEWEFVREFGRIGSPGRVMRATFGTLDEAASALTKLWQQKLRRGYVRT